MLVFGGDFVGRAERRRASRTEAKKVATYNLTEAQIQEAVEQKIGDELARARAEGYQEGMNQAMIMLLALPLEVLMNHFWKKSYKERLPKFTQYLLDYIERVDSGELDLQEMRDHLWEYGGVRFEEKDAESEEYNVESEG